MSSSSSNKTYKKYSPEYFWRRSINPRLSDDILVSIISLLPWRDAVRSSVLSRRWEKLWTYATGSLQFDCPPFKPSDGEKAEFISWVDNTVRLHQAPTIQDFGVSFCLDASSTSHIDAWIYFAIKKGAPKLHLNFTPLDYYGQVYDDETNYHFPNNINNLLHQQQQQQQNSAPIIHGFSSFFNSLKELSLMHVIVDEQLVHYLLSSCPHLEKLCLEHLGPAIENLRVEEPPSLKHLEILEFEGLESFEISAPNLVFIKYDGEISIKFKSVPKLKQAHFEVNTPATYLLADTSGQLSLLSQLESLTLEILTLTHHLVWIRELPLLHNLRKLALMSLTIKDDDNLLLFTGQLLKAAPLLHTLVCRFERSRTGCDRNRERTACKVPRDSHQYLKVVELLSFQGHITDVELATYLLETATSLEKMIIDIKSFKKPLEEAKKVCLEQLKETLPAGTELVIIENNWYCFENNWYRFVDFSDL